MRVLNQYQRTATFSQKRRQTLLKCWDAKRKREDAAALSPKVARREVVATFEKGHRVGQLLVKELNYRVKGSEKFWSTAGGSGVLQLKADTLSESKPLREFWSRRQETRTGFRSNVGKRKPRSVARLAIRTNVRYLSVTCPVTQLRRNFTILILTKPRVLQISKTLSRTRTSSKHQ